MTLYLMTTIERHPTLITHRLFEDPGLAREALEADIEENFDEGATMFSWMEVIAGWNVMDSETLCLNDELGQLYYQLERITVLS